MFSSKRAKFFLSTLLLALLSQASSNSVDFNLTTLDSPPEDLIWCGENKETIFILTEKSTVYRSTDKGYTWKNLKQDFLNKAKVEKESPKDKLGTVSKMIHSPVDKSLIFFLGTEGFSWISEKCGEQVRAIFQGRPINEFIFHPTERNWGLASAFSLCEDYVNEPCRIVKELFVTTTLGNDWKILGDYIHQFSWGVKDEKMIKAGVPKKRIIVTYQPRGRGNQKDKKWDYKVDFVYSDDFFDTKRVGVRKGNRFLLTDKYLYVSQVIDQDSQEVQLLLAPSTSKKYEFSPIITNQNTFKEHSFTFLDTSEDMVFLYVNNFGKDSKFGNVYASGDQGKMFSLSLKNNIQFYEGDSDFENVKSTEGVYLANAISGKYMKLARQEIENERSSASINNKKKKAINYRNYAKTLITHNKGGDWKRLNAPKEDSNGKPYDCGNYCFLHLHSYSSEIPQFYSVDTAPGIIIGNGNIGRYLDYQYNNMALFLSRDGGINWIEIRKGVYIYEIGDQGGLIVIAKYRQPTKSVLYSYDEGITWEELEISKSPIEIKNILIEPSSSAQNFLVYGIRNIKSDSPKGVVINLNFAALNMPTCSSSDYEIWTPTSSKEGHDCLLGRKVSYSRRKRESKCLNGEGFTRKVNVEICTCTEDDYQCDIGYHRAEPGDPCTPIRQKGREGDLQKVPEVCEGYYTISRGYRKVAGNFCKGGAKFEPIRVACPYNKFWYALKLLFYGILICGLLGLVYFTVITKGDEIKEILNIIVASFGDLKQNFSKIPENYLNVDNLEEDNTLFEDDVQKPTPAKNDELIETINDDKEKEEKKDPKEEKKKEKQHTDEAKDDDFIGVDEEEKKII